MHKLNIRDWKDFEKFLAQNLKMSKTVKSGAIFGDCDLYKRFPGFTIRCEAKFSAKDLKIKFRDYIKALHQCRSNEVLLLAIGNNHEVFYALDGKIDSHLTVNPSFTISHLSKSFPLKSYQKPSELIWLGHKVYILSHDQLIQILSI